MERQMRTAGRQTLPASAASNGVNGSLQDNGNGIRQVLSTQNMDDLLAEVGIAPAPSLPMNASAPNFMVNGYGKVGDDASSEEPVALDANLNRRPTACEIVHNSSISVHPKNDVKYSKVTQTMDIDSHMDNFSTGSADGFEFDDISVDGRHDTIGDLDLDGSLAIDKILGKVRTTEPAEEKHEEKEHVLKAKKLPPLTEQEKEKILHDDGFQKFVLRASRLFERAFAGDSVADIATDYQSDMDNIHSDALLTLKSTFNCEKYLQNQRGYGVEFCDAHPELMAVLVNGEPDGKGGPTGIINLWNTVYPTPNPELVFHATAKVRSVCFSRFHPKLVLGGCETGQLCVWDMRNNKKIPVSRSQISARGHTQTINGMHVVGTHHSHNLMTTSVDGVICWWSLDNMHSPVEKISASGVPTKKQLSIMSSDIFLNGFDKFILGGEDGCLYLGERHDAQGQMSREINVHDGSVQCVALHKTPGPADFSNYCLTGSMDFDMHLWNLQEPSEPVLSFRHKHGYTSITDIKWSPIHPAVFVSSSLNGKFYLWNLNTDTEDPVATMDFGQPIQRVCWSKDGHHVVGLGFDGSAQFYEVHETLKNVKHSEWDVMSGVLYEALQDSKPVDFQGKSFPRRISSQQV
uniref:WD_REPEATS_REGION domain-containing protein n=2 Tax=Bursaphelenchus xylophilus TaxID=6326 RepID=A0A1I7SC46_BURXY